MNLRIETFEEPKEWNQVRVLGSWMGWQAFDGYGHTACGTVEGFRAYSHPFPRDEDWNLGLTSLSVGRYLVDDTKSLVGDWTKGVNRLLATEFGGPDDLEVELEVPDEHKRDPSRWERSLKEPPQVACAHGLWMADLRHGGKPEIHPASWLWWPCGRSVHLVQARDQSGRFGGRDFLLPTRRTWLPEARAARVTLSFEAVLPGATLFVSRLASKAPAQRRDIPIAVPGASLALVTNDAVAARRAFVSGLCRTPTGLRGSLHLELAGDEVAAFREWRIGTDEAPSCGQVPEPDLAAAAPAVDRALHPEFLEPKVSPSGEAVVSVVWSGLSGRDPVLNFRGVRSDSASSSATARNRRSRWQGVPTGEPGTFRFDGVPIRWLAVRPREMLLYSIGGANPPCSCQDPPKARSGYRLEACYPVARLPRLRAALEPLQTVSSEGERELRSFRVLPYFACDSDPCSLGLVLTESVSSWLDGPDSNSVVSSFRLHGLHKGALAPTVRPPGRDVLACEVVVRDVPEDRLRTFTLVREARRGAKDTDCRRFGFRLSPRVSFRDGGSVAGTPGIVQAIVWREPGLLLDEIRSSLQSANATPATVDRVLRAFESGAQAERSPPALGCEHAARILAFAAKGTLHGAETPVSTKKAARYAIERCSVGP